MEFFSGAGIGILIGLAGLVVGLTGLAAYLIRDRRRLAQQLAQVEAERRVIKDERAYLLDMIRVSLNEIYIFDAVHFRFRFINEGALNNLGYSLPQIQMMTFLDLVPDFTFDKLQRLLQPLVTQAQPVQTFEMNYRRLNGSIYPVEVRVQLFGHENDQVFLAIANDVSKRKQAQEESHKFLRVVEQSPLAIVITDSSGIVEYANPRFGQVSGYSPQEVLGQNLRVLKIGKMTLSQYEALWRTVASGNEWQGEIHNRKKNGDPYWEASSISPIFNSRNEITHFISIQEDITTRKLAELERTRHIEELETIDRVSKNLRCAQNRTEIYRVILNQLVELLKAEAGALALREPRGGNALIEVGYGDWESWVKRRIPIGEGVIGQVIAKNQVYCNNRANDDPLASDWQPPNLLTSVVCTPFIIDGQVVGAFWIGRMAAISDYDLRLISAITGVGANAVQRQSLYEDLQVQVNNLNRAQSRLLQSEKLAAVGELVAGVAHELNNPLAAVILLTHLIQQRTQGNLDPETRRDIEQISTEAQHAAKIVRGLREFSRQSPPERKQVQINALIESSFELLKYELQLHQIECRLYLLPTLPPTQADPAQLKQVFVNLLNNAWQAISENQKAGHIIIQTGWGIPLGTLNPAASSEMLWIAVRDDGPGIPPAVMPRIFDPFFTTKPEGTGTGLGLSICHGIIAEHAGLLWAENNPEGGVTFYIQLPVISSSSEVSQPKEISAPPGISPQNFRIMVIDDEPSVLSVLTRTLKRAGYQVDAASDGLSAITYLEKIKYDLVICDMRMPDLNGMDLYWKIKEKDPELARRMIFTTGDVAGLATRHFFEQTGAEYLPKPFELKQLVEYVHHTLIKLAEHDES